MTTPAADTLARVPAVVARLRASKSKYVRVQRFSLRDRGALRHLIACGDVEIFESPSGRAYRLIERAPSDAAASDGAVDVGGNA